MLYRITDGENKIAIDSLKEFGHTDLEDLGKIERTIARKRSSLNLLDKRKKSDVKKEKINFWRLVSKVETARNFQLDVEKITLARWVEIVKEIKEINTNNQRNGRRKNRKGRTTS
ncbi:MAG: hypothetical protein KAS32_12360 [Candidatus Peribacteraceae bacterium]|nr:hypothetical protein [Candidatus Peribacteraceae bacterium]